MDYLRDVHTNGKFPLNFGGRIFGEACIRRGVYGLLWYVSYTGYFPTATVITRRMKYKTKSKEIVNKKINVVSNSYNKFNSDCCSFFRIYRIHSRVYFEIDTDIL